MSAWNRKLWGVELITPNNTTTLIGSGWIHNNVSHYTGEPTRALLFCTRRQAREWCHGKMQEYAGRKDCCADWRYRAVRVVESVRKKI